MSLAGSIHTHTHLGSAPSQVVMKFETGPASLSQPNIEIRKAEQGVRPLLNITMKRELKPHQANTLQPSYSSDPVSRGLNRSSSHSSRVQASLGDPAGASPQTHAATPGHAGSAFPRSKTPTVRGSHSDML